MFPQILAILRPHWFDSMKDTHLRSFVKGMSWRIIGTIDTIIISFFVTGTLSKALGIGISEVITKVMLFYVHERVWQTFGSRMAENRKKAIIKAITWRITGTLDTIFLSFIIISIGKETVNEQSALVQASTIGAIELITKITLFYLHERLWNRINLGRITPPLQHLGHDENTAPNKNELAG